MFVLKVFVRKKYAGKKDFKEISNFSNNECFTISRKSNEFMGFF